MTAEELNKSHVSGSEFAKRLRTVRHDMGMSQGDLAKHVGVQTQTVSQWERSLKRPQPRFYDVLISLLHLQSRTELRALVEQPARPRVVGGELAVAEGGDATAGGRGRLSVVPNAAAPAQTRPWSSAGHVLEAALSIISARDGRLSEREAEIVASLLAQHREMSTDQ